MKWALISAAALAAVSTSAYAAITPTLMSVVDNGTNSTFNYSATLAGDAGLKNGDRFVIFDFRGYVPGSVFSSVANFVASTQNVTTGLLTFPGFVDDPTLPNLVFTWKGGNFHTAGGPYSDVTYANFGAKSIYDLLGLGQFAGLTQKNNGLGPGGAGTNIYNTGLVSVPEAAPEPGVWALMIGGFGLVGASLRRRRAAPLPA